MHCACVCDSPCIDKNYNFHISFKAPILFYHSIIFSISPYLLFIDYFMKDLVEISKMIPDNGSIKMLAFGLAMAHFIYGDTKASVLFIVQPGEKNVRTHHPD